MWTPADMIELVKALFYGIALICLPLATAFTVISAARSKRAEETAILNAKALDRVNSNVNRLEKNTNSISERNQAIAMRLGITEGIAQERASIQAQGQLSGVSSPVPVADDRTANAAERSATATERVADAAEEVAKKTTE